MRKIKDKQLILLPRECTMTCPLYEHNGKYYIRAYASKPKTFSFNFIVVDGRKYSEVKNLGGTYFMFYM